MPEPTALTPATRPNIVLIMTDQHRADYLSCAGHPILSTPHIDALAERGTRFTRAYAATPVCSPNRASLMTGRWPSIHGLRTNGQALSAAAVTFPEVLQAAGYRTGLVGKSHLQPFTDHEADLGPNPHASAPMAEALKSDGRDYTQEDPHRWATEGSSALQTPYYGFDEVHLSTGHADMVGGEYQRWFQDTVGPLADYQGPDNALPSERSGPQVWRTAVPEEAYPTAWIRDRALDFVRQESAEPFFLMVSFNDPHHPFTPPGSYWGRHLPQDFAVPQSFVALGESGKETDPPSALEWIREQSRQGRATRTSQTSFALTDTEELQEVMALTCDMITMIDDAVGDIVTGLQQQGLAEDTVLIFTSDHGDFLGDHGLLLKGPLHYQSVTNVPLIWADPELDQEPSTSALVSTPDIAATILARCGVETFNGMQGRDFTATLTGADGPRNAVLIEEVTNRVGWGSDEPLVLRTLVTQQHRISVSTGSESGELYNLVDDPEELHNLWNEPGSADVKSGLLAQLVEAMMQLSDISPWPERVA